MSDGVATITLDRTARHNTLVPEFIAALREAFRTADSTPDVAAVVLVANGPTFSTGGDVRGFWDHRNQLAAYARATVGGLHALMVEMMRLPKPIVTAVHGIVTGGSLGLVLASDIVLVSPDASFTPWYAVVGFSPDGGWTALLPDRIGATRVADVLHTNRTITAEEAIAWGLASRLVPSATIRHAARASAVEIGSLRQGPQRSIKRLRGTDIDQVIDRLAAEEDAFISQIVTDEAQRGMAQFLGLDG